jgi:multiple sugar transport system substrate-binding protein
MLARLRAHATVWLALAPLLWTACQTQPAPVGPAPTRVETGDRAGRVSFMVFGDPAELRAYQNLVSAFEARYPAIAIELIHIPDQADYRRRLAVDFAAGTPADVVLLNYRRYGSFAARGVLEPLEPYLAQSSLIQEGDFYAQALTPFRWKRRLMCLPQNISSLVVYYNQDLFAAAGVPFPADDWTWDDFLRSAQALTRDLDGDGRTDQYGLGVEPSLFRAAPFIWQNNGQLVERPVYPLRLALDSPEAMQALQWFVDLQVRHRVVPGAEAEQAEDGESRFLNGRLAMYLNSRRGVPTYREAAAFDWDVAPLPRNRWRRANILHSDAYCMSAATQDKRAAWAFIEFANSPEGQALVAASGRTVPSLVAVAESPAFLDPNAKPQNSRVFLEVIPYLRAVPVLPHWAEVEDIASDELERAFYGHATVPEAVRTAVQRTEEYFKIR